MVRPVVLAFLLAPFYFNCSTEGGIGSLAGVNENEFPGDEENPLEEMESEMESEMEVLGSEKPSPTGELSGGMGGSGDGGEVAVARELSLSAIDLSDLDLMLRNPNGVTTAKVGERNFLFLTDRNVHHESQQGQQVQQGSHLEGGKNGVSVLEIREDGSLRKVSSVEDNSQLQLAGAWGVTTAEIGEDAYLFVSGIYDDGVSVFRIEHDGSLVHTDSNSDARKGTDVAKALTTAKVDGKTFLFAGGFNDNGLRVFRVKSNGKLRVKDDLSDYINVENDLQISDPWGMTTAEVDEETFLFVAGYHDDGMSVFKVENNGVLTSVTNVRDESDEAFRLTRPTGITKEVIDGNTFLFVAGRGTVDTGEDCGLNVFRIERGGKVVNVANFSDMMGKEDKGKRQLYGIWNLLAKKIGGEHYLFITQYFQDKSSGISIFRIEEGGNLVSEKTLTEGYGPTALERPFGIVTTELAGATYLFLAELRQEKLSAFHVHVPQ